MFAEDNKLIKFITILFSTAVLMFAEDDKLIKFITILFSTAVLMFAKDNKLIKFIYDVNDIRFYCNLILILI